MFAAHAIGAREWHAAAMARRANAEAHLRPFRGSSTTRGRGDS
jgi:hypothetical protein